ncbi:hypothetical protein BTA51_10035 [Hahella sp. CCB-MM4]|uniref:hypothetical protein n=1 Tax=Hahella sp. (strain CCB-MM4) TaxID=1926491 RepID=UPI000B9C6874|nr:hypothetical protein [Hahella sp. CCB-MM4]OZG73363.1 hypothetical protein BTA51_10035 [Hahella sp. CCB-MM4]
MTLLLPYQSTRLLSQRLTRLHFWWVILLNIAFAGNAHSAVHIYVVSPTENQVAEAFVKRFDTLRPEAWQLSRVSTPPPAADDRDKSIAICLGEKMLAQNCTSAPESLVLALFVSKDRLDDYQAKLKAFKLSGIYLDAPLQRQAELTRLLLPGVTQAAILSSQPITLPIQEAAGQTFTVYQLDTDEGLPRLLNRALEKSDYILGIPDFSIYNGRQIRQILLTAYRHNKVLIGPSLAFVNAGGLATTYSTAEDYAHQTVEMINSFLNDGKVPEPVFAKYFAVAVNRQVARSLNLIVPDAEALQTKLELLEAQP